ncbi:hypothetical protein HNP55_001689 [Paucibacter oligotrophus]|uniref:Protein phosphatase 2C-like protein n=1 Tax=Roseateles oligotrophus TaxID=1769250 RepID=A0A840L4N6_9BURK|nr:hypothetical protein [Roseateles oligotrophus]MBB4843170.1 hypothetical protein [Roseateles oligotrophus]
MKREFAGTCPKEPQEPASNEDRSAFSEDGARFALCDGASESYNSRLWAKVLAEKFAANPAFGPEWLAEALRDYIVGHDFEAMTWSQHAGFDRGSFSTLLGVEFDSAHRTVDTLAIGDCVAILVDGERFVEAWPFADPERFKEHPTLLATKSEHNAFVSELGFWTNSVKTFHLDACESPRLVCMTDALAEWTLRGVRDGEPTLSRLLGLASEAELAELVLEERAAKRMRVDDSTLIVVSFPNPSSSDVLPVA